MTARREIPVQKDLRDHPEIQDKRESRDLESKVSLVKTVKTETPEPRENQELQAPRDHVVMVARRVMSAKREEMDHRETKEMLDLRDLRVKRETPEMLDPRENLATTA